MKRILPLLFAPKEIAPLAVFRMIFGFLITAEAWGAILTGWVGRTFIEPDHTFPFLFVSWLEPLPGNGMFYYYAIMGVAGVLVMLGLFYRPAIVTYFLLWSAVYLMQKNSYNNHYYLLTLLCFFMCIVPAGNYASLDVKRNPAKLRYHCPQWCLWIFAGQIALVYIYASIAKMYPDWIEARPIHLIFENKIHYWLIGPLLGKEWFQHFVAISGILFDLLLAPGLLWKKTRKIAFMASVLFHLFNSMVFQVGIFPYMGIALGIFFFPPEKVRSWFFRNSSVPPTAELPGIRRKHLVLSYCLALYFLFQIILPLRHWWFPGNVHWTEEGHRLSWHMMLRVKSGYVRFKITDLATGKVTYIQPGDYLTPKQARNVATHPDLCYQFVQFLKTRFREKGLKHYSIYAVGKVSLNGHSARPLFDPTYDLSKIEWEPFHHAHWLTKDGL